MNQKIEDILEFHKIRHAVKEFANTQKAKTMILQLPIETNAKKIRHKIEETRDAVTLLRLKQGIPIPKLEDISVSIKRLEVEAGLNGRELNEILKVLQTTNQVANFFEKVKEEEITLDRLPQLVEKLEYLPEISKQLQLSIREDGYVLDDASIALKGIRQGISRTEQEIKGQLDTYVTGKYAKYLTDSLITIRNDRYVVPVKAEYKSTFGGIVHDQSSTGQTLFM